MSILLDPVLFLAVTDIQDLATNFNADWTDMTNALVEDANYAYATGGGSGARYTFTMNFTDPDFPAYPTEDSPSWFRVVISAGTNSSNPMPLYVRLASGARLEVVEVPEDQPQTTYTIEGTLSEFGITQQEARDIMDGVEPVGVYGYATDGLVDAMYIYWVKLEAIVQGAPTEIQSPAVVF